jgi:hypothetical protein
MGAAVSTKFGVMMSVTSAVLIATGMLAAASEAMSVYGEFLLTVDMGAALGSPLHNPQCYVEEDAAAMRARSEQRHSCRVVATDIRNTMVGEMVPKITPPGERSETPHRHQRVTTWRKFNLKMSSFARDNSVATTTPFEASGIRYPVARSAFGLWLGNLGDGCSPTAKAPHSWSESLLTTEYAASRPDSTMGFMPRNVP